MATEEQQIGNKYKESVNDNSARLSDQVYTYLESKIVTLEILPGTLLSELTISKQLGVSRTPVGDALQRLAREQLVTILPRRGIFVTEVSASEQLRLLELRREISRFVARTGAKRANQEEREQLRRVAERLLLAANNGDVAEVISADKIFHDIFATCAHNHFAAAALGPLDSLSRRFNYAHKGEITSDITLSATLHARIAQSIADAQVNEAGEAADALADYLDAFARRTLDAPPPL